MIDEIVRKIYEEDERYSNDSVFIKTAKYFALI